MPSRVAQGESLIKINVFTDSRCPFGLGLCTLPGAKGLSSPLEKGSLAFPKFSAFGPGWKFGLWMSAEMMEFGKTVCRDGKHLDSGVGVATSELRQRQPMHRLWGSL